MERRGAINLGYFATAAAAVGLWACWTPTDVKSLATVSSDATGYQKRRQFCAPFLQSSNCACQGLILPQAPTRGLAAAVGKELLVLSCWAEA